ncbi:MAG: hypothetical protein GHCLOJNM_04214 [bacterium]|nr:hypothetical protein [bacterium]
MDRAMPEIARRLAIPTDLARVFAELSTQVGLEGWLASKVEGEPRLGVRLKFSLGALPLDVVVAEMEAPRATTWRCVGGPDDWIGTDIVFRLSQEAGGVHMDFRHRRWREENSVFREAEREWEAALERLRDRLA